MSHEISFIGSGNLGTNLARTLHQHGFSIRSVISRHAENARTLASQVGATSGTGIKDIPVKTDTLFFSVSDNALSGIISHYDFGDQLLIHTAGSLPIDVFEGHSKNYGVLYPLQTFSKHRVADFMNAPIFIEANNNYALSRIRQIADKISRDVYVMNSSDRLRLHTAAVFTCNFVNHMYKIAEEIVEPSGLDIQVFEPLIRETTEKILREKDALKTQTGPALRNDTNTIKKHLSMLEGQPDLQDLYKMLSNRIFETSRNKNK